MSIEEAFYIEGLVYTDVYTLQVLFRRKLKERKRRRRSWKILQDFLKPKNFWTTWATPSRRTSMSGILIHRQ